MSQTTHFLLWPVLLCLMLCGASGCSDDAPAGDNSGSGWTTSEIDETGAETVENLQTFGFCGLELQCGGGDPACDAERRACVECVSAAECETGLCDTVEGECVECLLNSDCDTGEVCDALDFECVPACQSDQSCDGDLDRCDAATGNCFECEASADCDSGACSASGVCVECVDDSGCDGGELCFTAAGECVECVEDSDCGSGPGCVDFECIECLVDAQCGGDEPFCDQGEGECSDEPAGANNGGANHQNNGGENNGGENNVNNGGENNANNGGANHQNNGG